MLTKKVLLISHYFLEVGRLEKAPLLSIGHFFTYIEVSIVCEYFWPLRFRFIPNIFIILFSLYSLLLFFIDQVVGCLWLTSTIQGLAIIAFNHGTIDTSTFKEVLSVGPTFAIMSFVEFFGCHSHVRCLHVS